MKSHELAKKDSEERKNQCAELFKKLELREGELAARRAEAERHTATLKREDEALEVGDLRIVEMLETEISCSQGCGDSAPCLAEENSKDECVKCLKCSCTG